MPPVRDREGRREQWVRRGAPPLVPLSWVYAALVGVHRGLKRAPPAADRAPRVISVGNLEAGGSGKTPLAMWFLERAVHHGRAAAYVSRGYGSRASGRVVTAVLRDGAATSGLALTRVVSPSHPDLADAIGDEGAMVVRRVPSAHAFFSRDKRAAVAAASDAGAEVVVVDDGFQSWGLARHVDVVLLDAIQPLANGRVLPAGPLREPPSALRRADAVVFNGVRGLEEVERLRAQVGKRLRPGARVAGLVRRVELVPARAASPVAPRRALLVSAIARPDRLAESVASAGVTFQAHLAHRDHHRYDEADAERIAARARRERVDAVVTTEKDWTKLARFDLGADVWLARLEVTVIGDELPA